MMILAVYARKAGFSFEELPNDAFELMPIMEAKIDSDDNHFDKSDIVEVIEAYDDRYMTYPIDRHIYRLRKIAEMAVLKHYL